MEKRGALKRKGMANLLLKKIEKQLEELDKAERKEDALASLLIQVNQIQTKAMETLQKMHKDSEEERDRKQEQQAKIREENERIVAENKTLTEENAKLRVEIASNEAKLKQLLGALHDQLPKFKNMF